MKNVKRLLSLILCAVAVMHAQAETNLGFSIAGMQVNDQNCAILNDVLDLPTIRSEIAEKKLYKNCDAEHGNRHQGVRKFQTPHAKLVNAARGDCKFPVRR